MALQITILGLGRVGTALGLALGTLDPQILDVGRPVITGWDADKRAMSDARGRLAADRIEANLQAAVRDADVVILAVPYTSTRDLLEGIAPHLKNGAIVTDTADSKADILRWAGELLPATVDFVGGHPLIRFEGAMAEGSDREAFRDAIYCLVPSSRTRRAGLDGMESLVTAIGAKPYYIDAVEHDSYVAAAGHLPLALAVALMEMLAQSGGWREIQPIAGEALLRMTDLASLDPPLAADMLHGNAAALDGWLQRMIVTLSDLRTRLSDPAELEALLDRGQEERAEWLRSEPSVRPGEDAFHGNVQDVERPNLSGLFFGRRRSGAGHNRRG